MADVRANVARRELLRGSLAVAAALAIGGCRDQRRAAGARTTSLPPGGSAPVQPSGFEAVPARLTAPTGKTADLCVWLADTAGRQQRGLMNVTDLGGADGMAFVFAEPTLARFYMWQTPLPLSIGFFDEQGVYVSGVDMEPCLDGSADRCERYAAERPYVVALETPAGSLEELMVDEARLVVEDGRGGKVGRCGRVGSAPP